VGVLQNAWVFVSEILGILGVPPVEELIKVMEVGDRFLHIAPPAAPSATIVASIVGYGKNRISAEKPNNF